MQAWDKESEVQREFERALEDERACREELQAEASQGRLEVEQMREFAKVQTTTAQASKFRLATMKRELESTRKQQEEAMNAMRMEGEARLRELNDARRELHQVDILIIVIIAIIVFIGTGMMVIVCAGSCEQQ